MGRAYSLLNNKTVYIVSLVIYLAGSALCGAAPTSLTLIIGRALQGVGLAGVFGGTFILIARITPLRTRSLYAGLCGAAYAIASVVGPVLGEHGPQCVDALLTGEAHTDIPIKYRRRLYISNLVEMVLLL